MSSVITGLFENASQATLAIYRLEAMGVNEADISIVANNSYTKEDFAVDEGTKAAEGGLIGAASGGVLGAVVAGFTAVGTVATGGAGAAVGGTLGAAIGAFIPEHEIQYYEDAIEKGSILIGVKHSSDNKNSIEEVLENAGASNVSKA